MNDYAVSMDAPRQTPVDGGAIVIENLTVSYGANQVLKGLNLEVPAGSIFGFLGANGAGKTTTIKTLLGFRPPNGAPPHVLGYEWLSEHVGTSPPLRYATPTQSP